jgi:hypothetical protein
MYAKLVHSLAHSLSWSFNLSVFSSSELWFVSFLFVFICCFFPDQSQLQWYLSVYPTLQTAPNTNKGEEQDDLKLFEGGGLDTGITSTGGLPIRKDLYECVIKPGEALYFPPMWQHAILNRDPYTVFISTFT